MSYERVIVYVPTYSKYVLDVKEEVKDEPKVIYTNDPTLAKKFVPREIWHQEEELNNFRNKLEDMGIDSIEHIMMIETRIR